MAERSSGCSRFEQPSTSTAGLGALVDGTGGSLPNHVLPREPKKQGSGELKKDWKLIYPPAIDGDVKTPKVFRVNGSCSEKTKHNIQSVSDPRRQNRPKINQSGQGTTLLQTSFVIDDDYTAIPSKREVAITGLNDNVDEKFLRGLFKKAEEPTELVVYYHPTGRQHLGMAYIDFRTKPEADAFISKYDGKPLMGSHVRCFFDPLCYQISKLYEKKTNQVPPMPRRYDSLKSSRAIHRLREMCRRLYEKPRFSASPKGVSPPPTRSNAECSGYENGAVPEMTSRESSPQKLANVKFLSKGTSAHNGANDSPKYDLKWRNSGNSLRNGHNRHLKTEHRENGKSSTGMHWSSNSSSSEDDCKVTMDTRREKRRSKLTKGSSHMRKSNSTFHDRPASSMSIECIELPPSPPYITLENSPPPQLTAIIPGAPLPPPGLINPPKPVGLQSPTEEISSSSDLDKKLAMLFGSTPQKQPNEASAKEKQLAEKMLSSDNSSTDRKHTALPIKPTPLCDIRVSGRDFNYKANRPDRHNGRHKEAVTDNTLPVVETKVEELSKLEKTLKLQDIRSRVRNTISVELRSLLKRDLMRQLEVKAFGMLNDKYKKLREKPNNDRLPTKMVISEKKAFVENLPSSSPDSGLPQIDDGNLTSIFGWHSHREKMASLPSFKRKPEVKRTHKLPKGEHEEERGKAKGARSPSSERALDDDEERGTTLRPSESVSSLNASYITSDESESEARIDEDATVRRIEEEKYSLTSRPLKEEPTPVESDANHCAPLPKIPRLSKRGEDSDYLAKLSPSTPPIPPEERRIWPQRDDVEEVRVLRTLITDEAISQEDAMYIRAASKSEDIQNFPGLPSGRMLCLVETSIPVRAPKELSKLIANGGVEQHFDDPELEGIVAHKTGCARTEGYYKISKLRKRLVRRHEESSGRTIISDEDLTAIRHMQLASKDERATYRRLLTSIGADSILLRVNQLKYRKKMIKFARSRIHGWGLYALENIQQEEMIIEYVGEVVRPTVADEREKKYERRGMGSSYMFRIDDDAVIDATVMGNFGRFINHSCSPNCTARVVTVEGDKRIVIYSKRLIEKGEEITYDYKFNREDEASKIECLCGARNCQKFLN